MLEQILKLVKQQGQQSVVENQNVPNNLNNQVMAGAANTITGSLQNILSNGGLQEFFRYLGRDKENLKFIIKSGGSHDGDHLANNLVKNFETSACSSQWYFNLIPGSAQQFSFTHSKQCPTR